MTEIQFDSNDKGADWNFIIDHLSNPYIKNRSESIYNRARAKWDIPNSNTFSLPLFTIKNTFSLVNTGLGNKKSTALSFIFDEKDIIKDICHEFSKEDINVLLIFSELDYLDSYKFSIIATNNTDYDFDYMREFYGRSTPDSVEYGRFLGYPENELLPPVRSSIDENNIQESYAPPEDYLSLEDKELKKLTLLIRYNVSSVNSAEDAYTKSQQRYKEMREVDKEYFDYIIDKIKTKKDISPKHEESIRDRLSSGGGGLTGMLDSAIIKDGEVRFHKINNFI
jgi:hypothetical protein